jgi:hypothetical protein
MAKPKQIQKIRFEPVSRIRTSGLCQSLIFGSQCFIVSPYTGGEGEPNLDHGNLTEGEGSVQLTSFYNQSRSAAIDIANIISLFTKHATLARRSTVLSHPVQLVFSTLTLWLIQLLRFWFKCGLFTNLKSSIQSKFN